MKGSECEFSSNGKEDKMVKAASDYGDLDIWD